MFELPEKKDLKEIVEYPSLEQLLILKDICNRIYIARNITLSQDSVIDNLEKIDKLFRDRSNFSQLPTAQGCGLESGIAPDSFG